MPNDAGYEPGPARRLLPLEPTADSSDRRPSDLEDAEAIKVLMARYFRFMDTKRWPELRSLFADDMTIWAPDDVPGASPLQGADRVARSVERILGTSVSIHRGHTPEIEIVGPAEAQAIWAMDDTVEFPGDPERSFAGSGFYHATYVRHEGVWKIRSLTLRRLKLTRGHSARPIP